MNILEVLNKIEAFDPEVYDRLDTRRTAMRQFAGTGKKIALAALPMALASMFTKAYGKTNDAVTDALQLALKAEYLEAEFYATGLATTSLAPPADIAKGLQYIAYDELLHVELVKATLTALGATPDVPYKGTTKPAGANYGIDITAGGGSGAGPFAVVLASLDNVLAAAQVFEDTGVRAYKGQAGNVMSNNDVLTAALNIHSVEARHASWIREQRRKRGATIKPWIVGEAPAVGAFDALVAGNYDGEDNVTQGGANVQSLGAASGATPAVSATAGSESFDEPVTAAQVLALLGTPGSGGNGNTQGFFY